MVRLIGMIAFFLAALTAFDAFAHGPIHVRMDRVSKRIAESPLDAGLYVERALLHREHGELPEAQRDLEHSLTLQPDDPVAQTSLARVLLERGSAAEALTRATRVLTTEPTHPGARLVEARALVRTGEAEAAIASFDRLIAQLKRPSPDLILERKQVVLTADPLAKERALRGLERGIGKLGLLVTLALPAIELERELGRVDRALKKVAGLRKQSGRPTLWWVLESEILVEAKRFEAAARVAKTARAHLERETCRATRANVRLTQRLAEVEKSLRLASLPSESPKTPSKKTPAPSRQEVQ